MVDDLADQPAFTITISDQRAHAYDVHVLSDAINHINVIDLPHAFDSGPVPVVHILRRKNLNTDFTVDEQRKLADLIYGYLAGGDLVRMHMEQVDHIDNLFTDHRTYLYEVEKMLMADGAEQFVPLPIWEPLFNLPPGWERVRAVSGIPTTSLGLLPYNSRPLETRPKIPDTLKPDHICGSNFDTAQAVAMEFGRTAASAPGSFHFNAHAALGGPFTQMSSASSAVVFWAFHGILSEIYDKWVTCKMPGPHVKVVLGRNVDDGGQGFLEIFVIASTKKLWRTYQRRKITHRDEMDHEMMPPNLPAFIHWRHWEQLGDKELVDLKVVADFSGKLVLLGKGVDQKLYLRREKDGGDFGDWIDLDTLVEDFSATLNANHTLELLIVKPKDSSWVVAANRERTEGGSDFVGWSEITEHDAFYQVEAISDVDGFAHAFVSLRNGGLAHLWKKTLSSGGTAWNPSSRRIATDFFRMFRVTKNLDGRIEIFALKDAFRRTNRGCRVLHNWVNLGLTSTDWTSPAMWSGWEELRFYPNLFYDFAVGANEDGRLELFAISTAGKICHVWQAAPNSGWSNWEEIPIRGINGIRPAPPRPRGVLSSVDYTDCLKVFFHADDGFIYMAEQKTPNSGPWIGWTPI